MRDIPIAAEDWIPDKWARPQAELVTVATVTMSMRFYDTYEPITWKLTQTAMSIAADAAAFIVNTWRPDHPELPDSMPLMIASMKQEFKHNIQSVKPEPLPEQPEQQRQSQQLRRRHSNESARPWRRLGRRANRQDSKNAQ